MWINFSDISNVLSLIFYFFMFFFNQSNFLWLKAFSHFSNATLFFRSRVVFSRLRLFFFNCSGLFLWHAFIFLIFSYHLKDNFLLLSRLEFTEEGASLASRNCVGFLSAFKKVLISRKYKRCKVFKLFKEPLLERTGKTWYMPSHRFLSNFHSLLGSLSYSKIQSGSGFRLIPGVVEPPQQIPGVRG